MDGGMTARFIGFFKKEFSNNLQVVQLLKGERVGKRRSLCNDIQVHLKN